MTGKTGVARLRQAIESQWAAGEACFSLPIGEAIVICDECEDELARLAWAKGVPVPKDADGTMYDGMFIVGIETPDGQATYHYDIDPYWDLFRCTELWRAPEWDGHTPDQAIDRIGKLADIVDRPTCRNLAMRGGVRRC